MWAVRVMAKALPLIAGLPVEGPVLPHPGWLWRSRCEPREEQSRCCMSPGYSEGEGERAGGGRVTDGSRGKPPGGRCCLLGGGWDSGTLSEARSGEAAVLYRSRVVGAVRSCAVECGGRAYAVAPGGPACADTLK